jgi:hypothetical protein
LWRSSEGGVHFRVLKILHSEDWPSFADRTSRTVFRTSDGELLHQFRVWQRPRFRTDYSVLCAEILALPILEMGAVIPGHYHLHGVRYSPARRPQQGRR